MKTYNDIMQDIEADELYEALLAYGLFSEKLPPFLSSEDFYKYCIENTVSFANKERQYAYYENMRNINIPRPLGIPNPMAYQRLCKNLSDNWDYVREHFRIMTSNQNYKVSRIHIRKMKGKKQLFEMNYSNWKLDGTPEPDLLIGKRFIVKADVSQCFLSMYTHSITWALVGKETAKKSRRGNWYNDLDQSTQNIKYGETHGLLIGPHTSNILSEIILLAIDNNLVEKGWQYVRHIDDYTCYVKSEQDAQRFLVDLQEELRKFDLSLNHKKTLVKPLPFAASENWLRRINSISIVTSYGKVDYKNCSSFFDYAIEIAKEENGNSAILKYAIKVLSGRELTESAKTYMEKTVFHLCLIYPYLVPLLEEYIFKFCKTSKESIEDISKELYQTGIDNRNYEISSYAIFYAIKYDFHISDVNVDAIKNSDDCILLLLGFIYFQKIKDRTSSKVLKDYAKDIKKINEDLEKYWLFVYEVLPQTDLKDEWKELKKAKVSFIKNSFKL